MEKAIPPPAGTRARGFATFDEPPPPLLVDEAGEPDYPAIRDSAEFRELRRRTALFVVPAVLGFLTWYLGYVALSAYAPGFMGTPVVGLVNVGMVFGLLQFATTIALTAWYARHARRRIDPQVAAVRALTAEERR
ncbi:DUF485 domain-containing protein [Saccharothrix australiensis]|uniref:Uncharacterized membrane protein (DUF485 family) n=1 Tax=Saccharothrix australiensis TaxID=2072 RepID=A0A495W3P7_9PSEU|nr:DUF485 domain-containing protein [Saccharothrix australiensis]RKT56341.1 uncharacterized membrane protein (DUF485 family) [Saccharothrix australiensis]